MDEVCKAQACDLSEEAGTYSNKICSWCKDSELSSHNLHNIFKDRFIILTVVFSFHLQNISHLYTLYLMKNPLQR